MSMLAAVFEMSGSRNAFGCCSNSFGVASDRRYRLLARTGQVQRLRIVGPLTRVSHEHRQYDDDDRRSDQGGQIGINALNSNLGKNGCQCRKTADKLAQ